MPPPTPGTASEIHCFGQFQLFPARRLLLKDGHRVRIGDRALELLLCLVEQAGTVVGKDALIERVWPERGSDDSGLRVQVAAVRRALEEAESGARYVVNVPLRGYCFVGTLHAVADGDEDRPAPLGGARVSPSPLPGVLTRLIGRGTEIEAVVRDLSDRRLVSLVGIGGIGKTTVALSAADAYAERHGHEVHFIDFAPVGAPHLVTVATLTALGVPAQTDQPLQELSRWLSDSPSLLVLDNCEHVVEAVADLVDALLNSTPAVRILVTSREPLRIRDEWIHRLQPLPSPPADFEGDASDALAYPAFELFIERATASLHSFSPDAAETSAVASICRRLDGLPLAIELVAARVNLFGVQSLVDMLSTNMTMASSARRTAQPRHRTIEAAIGWSHALLSPQEQKVFRQLSVFRERFSLDGAIQVADGGADTLPMVLMNLVGKSLVSADPGGDEVMYRLLETTRVFASDQLHASSELPETARRHVDYCRRQILIAAREIETLPPARWRERHARMVADVRAALDWCFGAQGDTSLALALVAECAPLLFGLSLLREYLQYLELAISRLPGDDSGSTLNMQLQLAYGQTLLALRGPAPAALKAFQRCDAMADVHRETSHMLRSRWCTFSWHLLAGEYTLARDATERFGTAAAESTDGTAVFTFHRMMALCLHYLGEQESALSHARRALNPAAVGVLQMNGNPFHFDHRTASLTQLARTLWLTGKPDQAMRAALEAVETAREIDHALSRTYALSYGAIPLALWRGDVAPARTLVEELRECTERFSLVFWQSWPATFDEVLRTFNGDGGPEQRLQDASLHFSHVDMLATLHPRLVGPAARSRAAARANPWCIAEVMRSDGLAALALGRRDEAASQLEQAIRLAETQGAKAWMLRAAIDLATLWRDEGRTGEARTLLQPILERFDEGFETSDLARARDLAARLKLAPLVRPGARHASA